MALNPNAVADIAEVVLSCVCAALDDTAAEVDGYPGCPTRTCVVPGLPDWECDDGCTGGGGQLTVNLSRIYTSTNFPQDDGTVQGLRGCQPPPTNAVELVVTLLRCSPVVTQFGCAPACEDLSATSRILHIDAAVILSALTCCLPHTAGRRGRRFVMGMQRVIGPQGGCVGIEQRVTVAVPGCAPCPGGES